MLRLGKMADYALLVTHELVKLDTGRLTTTEELAQKTHLTITTVRKLLKYLVDAQVVKSFRGVKGGYQLAGPAEQISVAQVIAAVDGPIALTACSRDSASSDCQVSEHCELKENWSVINSLICQALERISLRDMSRQLATAPGCAHDAGDREAIVQWPQETEKGRFGR